MRFSFYNTVEKSEYFLSKFKDDRQMQLRRTNKYQNMFNRKILAEEIVFLLSKSKEKMRNGL